MNSLIMYQFVLPSVLAYLTDYDIVTRLLLIGKSLQDPLKNYHIKQTITQARVNAISSTNRYTSLIFVSIKEVFDLETINKSCKQIYLCADFNQPILPGSLPSSLTHLTFGSEFNQPILQLPSSIRYLTVGIKFNQIVLQGSLPSELKEFNPIVDVLWMIQNEPANLLFG